MHKNMFVQVYPWVSQMTNTNTLPVNYLLHTYRYIMSLLTIWQYCLLWNVCKWCMMSVLGIRVMHISTL